MKIAIVGTGIAGLVCAALLHPEHDITVYESNDYIGGHTHTVKTPSGHGVDTGFIVFNEQNYPNFSGLLTSLGVKSQPTTMSFSVRDDAVNIEYCTASLNHLFAKRSNLFRPSYYRMLIDILRFNRESMRTVSDVNEEMTVREYLHRHQYSETFQRHFFYPISAALWSCPLEKVEDFPIRFILEFYLHHGMHKMMSMPVWRVIIGGSSTYVGKLIEPFRNRVMLNTPVRGVHRNLDGVDLVTNRGAMNYDEVIMACHSDQSLRILDGQASSVERDLLGVFPYSKNAVTLHTDTSVLPRRKRAWGCWNYQLHPRHAQRATVTYNMNLLQRLQVDQTYCVSLNQDDAIEQGKVISQLKYDHPLFTQQRATVQERHHELIRRNRTSFCGAYWGNGFHEAGVVSALRVCRAFGVTPSWSTMKHSERATSAELIGAV